MRLLFSFLILTLVASPAFALRIDTVCKDGNGFFDLSITPKLFRTSFGEWPVMHYDDTVVLAYKPSSVGDLMIYYLRSRQLAHINVLTMHEGYEGQTVSCR